jgi:integrase
MAVQIREEVKKELKNVVKGICLIPSVKKMIVSDLSKEIDLQKVEDIFNGKQDVEILEPKEAFHFFKVIFAFTKDEKFNPVSLGILEEKKEEEILTTLEASGERPKTKPKKDDVPKYYYDYEFKNKFIIASKYKPTTARVVRALFRHTAKFEKAYAKDLYEFDIKELEEVLKSLKAKTIRSLQNSISTIEQYIDFAIKEKRLEYEINYATLFNSKEKIEKLLDKEAEENMIFNKDEIMRMALDAENAQDGVILGLIFDGVSHKNEFEELINLTEDDVDFDNQEIKIVKDGEVDRVIPMSTETAILVRQALKDDTYVSVNGEKVRKYKVAEGKNILRGLRGKIKVQAQIISARIARMAEFFGYEYLNATTVSYSGQLHYAKQLLDEGYTMDETIDKVLHRFGIPINSSSQFYLKNRIEKYLDVLNKK